MTEATAYTTTMLPPTTENSLENKIRRMDKDKIFKREFHQIDTNLLRPKCNWFNKFGKKESLLVGFVRIQCANETQATMRDYLYVTINGYH